ncbi:gibberellin-regulated protein 14-like [Vitis riparia]|uniref:gibberellin-regulated protein 14-like n=1 Tax=Vitis riparia TaxID=96939 RepID=UPI00155A5EFB|nr:gibberellin-regulated protein 14-like [Vitis riparia]
MAKIKGAKTPSPSARTKALRVSPVQDSMTEPSQPPAVPPSVEGVPPSPLLRRYETRRPPTTPGASSSSPKKSTSRPPKKKAKVSALVEPSEPSSEPQLPTTDSQIPSGMTPEVIIRWPMVTQPPIEGNLDCRARPFHSELCFDRETFRL